MLWTAVFLIGITLILGHVRLYERRVQIEKMEEELRTMELELGELRNSRRQLLANPEELAESVGMYRPEPEEYLIVHVRGLMETSKP